MGDEWDYVTKLRNMTNDELYAEEKRVSKKLKQGRPYGQRSRRTKPKAGGRELYCICRKPNDGQKYIACGTCGDWYHPTCVGIPNSVDVDSYPFTCSKCQKVGNDDVYVPIASPPYDPAVIDPPRNKRKKTVQNRNNKRVKKNQNDFVNEFDFSTNLPKDSRKSKKRKRVNSEEGGPQRKIRSRNNKRNRFADDDSDVDDAPVNRRRKSTALDSDDDDDTHEQAVPPHLAGDSEFKDMDSFEILQYIVKHEKQAERLKVTSQYKEQIQEMSNKLRLTKTELNDEQEKASDLDLQIEQLKLNLNYTKQEMMDDKKRYKQALQKEKRRRQNFDSHNMGRPRVASGRYAGEDDDNITDMHKSLHQMENAKDRIQKENNRLKQSNDALKRKLGERDGLIEQLTQEKIAYRNDETLHKKMLGMKQATVDTEDSLTLESSLSKDAQAHLERVSGTYQETLAAKDHEIARLRKLLSDRNIDDGSKSSREKTSQKRKKPPKPKNSSSKSKKKNKKSPVNIHSQTTPSIPKTLEVGNPIVTRSTSNSAYYSSIPTEKISPEKLQERCHICQSNNPENMQRTKNANHNPSLPTVIKLSETSDGKLYYLANAQYTSYHTHCKGKAQFPPLHV